MKHIGIINYNKKIIYIDLLENNLECYYYHNHEKKNISINTVLELLKSIFDKTKEEFLEQDGEYKIFINKETGYKHFYKDGKEDIIKFFLHNGENAILCKGLDIKDKYNEIKEFFNKNKDIKIILTLNLALTLSNSFNIYNLENNVYNAQQELEELNIASLETEYNEYYDYTSLSNSLKSPANIGELRDDFLYNEDLIRDICNTPMTEDRIMSLKEKTTDIEVVTVTYEEMKERGLSNAVGYYNVVEEPNVIHTVNLNNPDTIYHELIHLLQDNNEYKYVKEACAEIISTEYYGCKIASYQEEVKRIQILMEIIGSDAIWDINFNGDDSKLDEVILNHLPVEEYGKLYGILITNIGFLNQQELDELNNSFDEMLSDLYYSIYGESIEENEIIQNIYQCYDFSQSTTLINNRHYFQDVENKRPDFIKSEYMTLKDAIDKNIVKVEMKGTKEVRVSEDEYKERLSKNLKTEIGYNSIEGVKFTRKKFNDEIVTMWEYKGELYPTKEALEKGLIEAYYYYLKDEIVDYNTIDEEKEFANLNFGSFSKTIIPLTDEYDNVESYSYKDVDGEKQEIVKLSDNIYISNENTKIDEQSKSR